MIVLVNGKEKTFKSGVSLRTAIAGEPYVKDSLISVHLSMDKVVKETSDFEIQTRYGNMVMHLNDSEDAEMWRTGLMDRMAGLTSRWVTHNIIAFGSFPTEIEVDRGTYRYKAYDCFLSLGGFDNQTTYIMMARDDHEGSYGAGHGVIGRITVGRHILEMIREGDDILGVRPLMSETSTENVVVTKDLTYKLADGYRVETNVAIKLDPESPVSAEHVIVLAGSGRIVATDVTGSYLACSEDLDVEMPAEAMGVREKGTVSVRCDGTGTGRMYIYKDRRQMSVAHNIAGQLTQGTAILAHAKQGDSVTVTTDPARILSVGRTVKDGEEYLRGLGIEVERVGDTSDDAIIAEQSPERTIDVLREGKVEITGVPKNRVFSIQLTDKDPRSVRYFKKITGLSHKPIGSLTVQFTFEGMPMVTFYGDEMRGKDLVPQDPFKKVRKGDIGITNQARPQHGLIGIRLEDSKDFGPTGEEPYGTNIIGKFTDDLDRMMKDLKDDDVIYITEAKL